MHQDNELGQTLQAEIKISPKKAIAHFIFLPAWIIALTLYTIYFLKNNPDYFLTISAYIFAAAQTYLVLCVILLFPLSIIVKDITKIMVMGIINLVHDVLSPSYFKIYKKGMIIRGYGYLSYVKIKDLRYILNQVTITISHDDFKSPSIIKRLLYPYSLKLRKHPNYHLLIVNFDHNKMNMKPLDIDALLPKIENEDFQPEMTYTVEQVKNQRKTKPYA